MFNRSVLPTQRSSCAVDFADRSSALLERAAAARIRSDRTTDRVGRYFHSDWLTAAGGASRAGIRAADVLSEQFRNLGLAWANFESTNKKVVGPWFGNRPNVAAYTWDRGTFVQLLPFMEGQSQADQFDPYAFSVSTRNAAAMSPLPPVLRCPSSGSVARLTRLSEGFGRPEVADLESSACDYSVNFGYYDPTMLSQHSVTDGPSHRTNAGGRIGQWRRVNPRRPLEHLAVLG